VEQPLRLKEEQARVVVAVVVEEDWYY